MEMVIRELKDLRHKIDGVGVNVAELREQMATLASKDELAEIRAQMAQMATKEELAEIRAEMATKRDLTHLYATVRADMHQMQQELTTNLVHHVGREIASHMGTIEEHLSTRFDAFEERWESRWQDSERWRQRVVEAIGGI